MREGIRQFLTYEQLLKHGDELPQHSTLSSFRRPEDVRQSYFDALELLRGHLNRCLDQIAAIAGMESPLGGMLVQYQAPWLLQAYIAPPLTDRLESESGRPVSY
ncbi:MAG: hypothetical protein WA943_12920 [Parvibaculum sp.]|uniref:hypothetical protein n=1 Tax=Parvibaculum sp. TaxID=2024848 RepID=UPI003C72CDFD